MKAIRKEVALLAITHNDALALEILPHQGGEILSCPGTSKDGIIELASKILGGDHADRIQPFGRAIDVIIKPNESVELVIDVYKIEITNVTAIQLPKNYSWFSKEQLSKDPRGRRDARFYLRLLGDQPLDLEYSEEQLGKWIDAKLLYWCENRSAG